MTRILCTAVGLWAAVASAQTVTTAPLDLRLASDPSLESYRFGGTAICGSTLSFQWSYAGGYIVCGAMQVWSTENECGDAPATGDKRYADIPAATLTGRQGLFSVITAELPAFAAATVVCGAADIEKTHRICAAVKYSTFQCGSSEQTLRAGSGYAVTFDSKAPAAPVIDGIDALDSSLKVTTTVGTDVAELRAQVKAQGTAGFVTAPSTTSDGVTRITGLVNDTTYDVQMLAVDSVGNVSLPSDAVAATPVRTVGFWGAYRQAGGGETGTGCSSVGAGALGPLSLMMLSLLRRRRSR